MKFIKFKIWNSTFKLVILIVVLAVVGAGATVVLAKNVNENSINVGEDIIYGCYNNNTGILRIVDNPDQCRNNESSISWQRDCECVITLEEYLDILSRLEALESQVPPDGTPCDDNNSCTVDDVYLNGECIGTSVDCEDGNPCTDDSCDPAIGCVHQNNTDPCDDENACTTDDMCSQGECIGVETANCDDGNICTDNYCDPELGCVSEYNNALCDDGNACTTGDTCSNGECAGVETVNCDDDNPCTDDSCDSEQGCVNVNNTSECDDGDPNTINDVCVNGECIGEPISN